MKRVSFEEVGAVAATFLAEEGVKAGDAVAVTGNGTVGTCAAGKLPCGVALGLGSDGVAAVQVRGAATVRYSGEAILAGWGKLTGDGAGGVKKAGAADEAGELLVLEADGAGKTVVVLF